MNLEPSLLRPWLRSPWIRLVVATLAVVAAVAAASLAAAALGGGLVAVMTVGLVAWPAYLAYVHLVERRSATELAAPGAVRELAAGTLVGALLVSVVILVLWLSGACTVGRGDGVGALVPAVLAALGASVFEEILLRGIGFRLVEERLGSAMALMLTAALFGAGHALNGTTPLHCVAIAVEAGVLLAAAYMVTRRLWLPIGLHVGWNAAQSGIFGTSKLGDGFHGLLATQLNGPELLTGDRSGLDTSIVAVGVCVLAAAGLLWHVHQSGQWRHFRSRVV